MVSSTPPGLHGQVEGIAQHQAGASDLLFQRLGGEPQLSPTALRLRLQVLQHRLPAGRSSPGWPLPLPANPRRFRSRDLLSRLPGFPGPLPLGLEHLAQAGGGEGVGVAQAGHLGGAGGPGLPRQHARPSRRSPATASSMPWMSSARMAFTSRAAGCGQTCRACTHPRAGI